MAKDVKKKKKVNKNDNPPFETRDDIKCLYWYTVIVPHGHGDNISKLLKENRCSAVFIQIGEGTATNEVRGILGIEDTRKDIVHALIREDAIKDAKEEIDAYFAASKRNKGIAYTIKLDSIIGVKMYKFLTQTIRG